MTLLAGIHRNISTADYFDDPTPDPSLSQSIAKLLLRSPAHARHAHPRLNPNWEASDATKYDIGNIAHRLLLGRGRDLEIVQEDSWRTNAAKDARIQAAAKGKLAVLEKDHDIGLAMMRAATDQLEARGYDEDWFGDNDCEECAEVVVIAQATAPIPPELSPPSYLYMIWLRAMIDWLPSLTRIWDLKTTSASAAPDEVWRRMYDGDWPLQAAMHERILNLLDPQNVGRRQHRFVVQEAYEPYALTVVRLTEAHMTIGRKQLARAEAIWARCMATGEWPAYPMEDASPEYPAWAVAQMIGEGDADIVR